MLVNFWRTICLLSSAFVSNISFSNSWSFFLRLRSFRDMLITRDFCFSSFCFFSCSRVSSCRLIRCI
uniref:Putative secreted peptide n=1 Tax=Anopheles braziliensis TaxID=58242 RepID=A0A2M3ZT07_9DIPT